VLPLSLGFLPTDIGGYSVERSIIVALTCRG
jgi:hypothetical protein